MESLSTEIASLRKIDMIRSNEATATVLIPIYISLTSNLRQSLIAYIRTFLENLEISSIDLISLSKRFIKIKLIGKDSQIGKKFLERELGTIITWEDIREQTIFRGFVKKVTEESFIIDIGISSNGEIFYANLDFNTFAGSIMKKRINANKELIKLFGIREYFPLFVKVNKNKPIDEKRRLLRAELSGKSIRLFRSWIKSRLDRLIVYGSTRTQLEKAIKKSGHFRDIISVERLGFLENALVCKWNTNAKGLIPEIGPLLPNAILATFYPRRIKKVLS